MAKIGVLTIHGMGRQEENYNDVLKAGLNRYLDDAVKRDLTYASIWFHPAMEPHQDALWTRMRREKLDWKDTRRFFLFYFSDASTYESRSDVADSVYRAVHEEVRTKIDALRVQLGDADAPVVVFAHSLGCQVLSNYIWDAQASRADPANARGIWRPDRLPTDFQALGTTRLFFTTGCNIPLFVSGLPRIEAIRRPGEHFEWFNYYDRDDVLGWPLRPLSEGFENAYAAVVTEDVEISVGWTPKSHTGYWKSGSFVGRVAEKLTAFHRTLG